MVETEMNNYGYSGSIQRSGGITLTSVVRASLGSLYSCALGCGIQETDHLRLSCTSNNASP